MWAVFICIIESWNLLTAIAKVNVRNYNSESWLCQMIHPELDSWRTWWWKSMMTTILWWWWYSAKLNGRPVLPFVEQLHRGRPAGAVDHHRHPRPDQDGRRGRGGGGFLFWVMIFSHARWGGSSSVSWRGCNPMWGRRRMWSTNWTKRKRTLSFWEAQSKFLKTNFASRRRKLKSWNEMNTIRRDARLGPWK